MRALISVSNKDGLVAFAEELVNLGWEILSTSGTMKVLKEAGLPVIQVSDVTNFPEICEGRVKTLHPKIHGALLARRDEPSDMQELKDNSIETIDLVCVNLYPFKQTIARENVSMDQAIENIDIGGPSMLRSAAKNWKSVTVLVNPEDYSQVLAELKEEGQTSEATRLSLSAKAYTHTAEYDMAIAHYMRGQAKLPEKLFLSFDEKQSLRYGENPHQEAKFYSSSDESFFSLADAVQLNGKELSYNNIQDANACLNIIREFPEPCAVGLKHMNPCGAAVGETILEAWSKAYSADKVSIFGGIVAFNREVDLALAELLKPIFLEIIMAPSFSAEALEYLSTKKNLRLLQVNMDYTPEKKKQYISVNGGLLVQNLDLETNEILASMCVTNAQPSESELRDLNFAWRIVKHVKSNAIVVVKNGMTYGVGAGQMNRIGSARIALEQASATLQAENPKSSTLACEGAVLASDGFFPFDDNVQLASEYGITSIVQPGGSVKDDDSIKMANDKGISMLFSGQRHFKH